MRGEPTGSATGASRLVQLDFLRGIAIFAVLGMHSPSEAGGSGWLRPLDAFLHRYGWTGVDLFFVLSGYLIGGLLFSELKQYGNFDARRFFVRRALRIWPSYYTLVAFLFLSLWLDPAVGLGGAWQSMWPAFIHVQNFVLAPRDHLWSLAVEEHFYTLLPLFLLLVTRRRDNRSSILAVPIACLVICVASALLRSVLFLTTHHSSRTETYMCIDALFFGVNLAYFKTYRPEVLAAVVRRPWTFWLGLALLLPAGLRSDAELHLIGFTLTYLGFALILLHVVAIRPGVGLSGRFLASWAGRVTALVGMNSFSIYLWHRDTGWLGYRFSRSLMSAMHAGPTAAWLFNTVAFFTLGILGGLLIDKLIEQPSQRLRAHLFPARPTTTTSDALKDSVAETLATAG